jgi:hypothetical protein
MQTNTLEAQKSHSGFSVILVQEISSGMLPPQHAGFSARAEAARQLPVPADPGCNPAPSSPPPLSRQRTRTARLTRESRLESKA